MHFFKMVSRYGLWNQKPWGLAAKNSFIIAVFATIGSVILGTVAALGLSSRHMPFKGLIMATLISPMIVPLIISGVAIFFFIAKVGLAATHLGIIIAHIILGTPFVVITVTATLSGFDHSVTRAAASLGSNPVNTFENNFAANFTRSYIRSIVCICYFI